MRACVCFFLFLPFASRDRLAQTPNIVRDDLDLLDLLP